MIVRISNIRIPVTGDVQNVVVPAAKKLKVKPTDIQHIKIIRRSLDARRKYNICFVYTVEAEVDLRPDRLPEGVKLHQTDVPPAMDFGSVPLKNRPVIIGMGPAGLFAALELARQGYRPLVLERGKKVEERSQDVNRFWSEAVLDSHSNVQFGEGGAGTFSDGKLTTRVNDPLSDWVLQEMVAAGAPEDIAYVHKPHVGTDALRTVVKNVREKIIALGGEVRFQSRVTNLLIEQGALQGVMVNDNEQIPCQVALLGIGHSARDTYAMLKACGIALEAKALAIGVRVEHPQAVIDRSQYGELAGHPNLGAADYSLVYQHRPSGRPVYSFCMCPGGLVVAAASEQETVVTNGMSHRARNSGLANSALVVGVQPEDFASSDVLAGIEFQRKWEKLAYRVGGGNYRAPAQTVGDFLASTPSTTLGNWVQPSYQPGIIPADLAKCLPPDVVTALRDGIQDFGRKIKGFDHPDAILTGVETRTSAPVRILRQEDGQSINVQGLYPIGEGAGYAGGIMSAAFDGVNAAIKVMREYKS